MCNSHRRIPIDPPLDLTANPERRAAVEQAVQAGNARGMAELKKTWDLGKAVVSKADRFYESFKRRDVDVHLPRTASAWGAAGRGTARGGKLHALVTQQWQVTQQRADHRSLRSSGSAAPLMTSTSRTARCGPACQVVWQGYSR
jgi:hypothetical protein